MIKTLVPEEVAEQWISAFNDADRTALRACCRDDLIVHAASTGEEAPPGLDRVFALVDVYRAAFPQGRFAVESIDTDGDILTCRWIARGSHDGPLLYLAPTHRDVTVHGACRFGYVGGLIAELWFDFSLYDVFGQVGALLPEPGRASPASEAVSAAAMAAWADALQGQRLAFDQMFSDDVVVHGACLGICSTACGREALDALWAILVARLSGIEVAIDDCAGQGATTTYRGRLTGRLQPEGEVATYRLYCMFTTAHDKVRELWTRVERRIA